MIEASTAVKLSDLVRLFQDVPACDNELAAQLLESFPILLLRQKNVAVVVNLEELVMSPDSFTTLLALNSSCSTQVSSSTLPKFHKSRRSSSKCGTPTHLSRYPQIFEQMTEFIKHHGFLAHSCHCEDVGTAGVSLDEIRKHIFWKLSQG